MSKKCLTRCRLRTTLLPIARSLGSVIHLRGWSFRPRLSAKIKTRSIKMRYMRSWSGKFIFSIFTSSPRWSMVLSSHGPSPDSWDLLFQLISIIILSKHSILGWVLVRRKPVHKIAQFLVQRLPISTSIHQFELTCHYRTKWRAIGHLKGLVLMAKMLPGSHHASKSVKEFAASKVIYTPAKRHQPLTTSNANKSKTISPIK